MADERFVLGGDGPCPLESLQDDVSLLADHGLLFIVEDGQSKRPYLPYERIHLDIELVGGEPGEDPAPA